MFHTYKQFFRGLFVYAILTAIFSAIILSIVFFHIPSAQNEETTTRVQPVYIASPQSLTTDTWGIFDIETGEIIAGNNVEKEAPIASISKLFTALSVLESPTQHDSFIIQQSDINTEGRSGKLTAGDKMTPYELLFPLLIESSNDAAKAIARQSKDSLAQTVTHLKETLSLQQTTITEPSGLSPHNTSTVQDLASFYAYLKQRQPHILDITTLRTYISSHTGYINNDPAVTFDSFLGGKHGFTPEAGRTFVGAFDTGSDAKGVGIVILGSENLMGDITKLRTEGERLRKVSDILAE